MSRELRAVAAARRLRISAAAAYRAWLDAPIARRWLFATATAPNRHVRIDPRIHGEFVCVAYEAGGEVAYEGRYLDLAAPHRLAFTLTRAGFDVAPTRVFVDIEDLRDGCRVAVAEHGVPRGVADRARARWIGMLHGLDEILGEAARERALRRPPTPRRTSLALTTLKEPTWTTC